MNIIFSNAPVAGAKTSGSFRGKGRCKILRKHNLELNTQKNSFYEFAAVCKDGIRQFYSGEIKSRKELMEAIAAALEEYPLETMRIKRDMMRLLNFTDSLGVQILPTAWIDGDVKAVVSPDFYYTSKDDKLGDILHVSFVRMCKPDIKQKGRKLDGGPMTSIELYFGVLYCRELAKKLGLEDKVTVRSEYIFARSEHDSSYGAYSPELDASQVVFLDDTKLLDVTFEKQIEEFLEGRDECEGDTCDHCPNQAACQYQKSPEPFELVVEKKDTNKKPMEFTPAQAEVVNFDNGYARVIAKAGSGKTTCVIARVVRLVKEVGEDIKKMALLTFSEVGAETMKSRLCASIEGLNPEDITAETFHKFCYDIIKANFGFWGRKKAPKIIDANPVIKKQWLDEILTDKNLYTLPNRYFLLDWAIRVHDVIKSNGLEYSSCADELRKLISGRSIDKMTDTELLNLIDVAEEYEERVKTSGYVSFDDLLPMALEFLEAHPEYVEEMGLEHIIVDEAQDTDEKQIKLLSYLIKSSSFKSLMIVGDDSQSIYSWRGAELECFLNFFVHLGVTGQTFRLSENHRSTKEILDLANKIDALNENRAGTDMVASRGTGIKPCIMDFSKPSEEIEFTCDQIGKAIKSGRYTASDIAIISRTRDSLVAYAAELSRRGIPWISKYPMPLLDNSRVKAAVSLAEAFYQPDAEDLYFNYVIAENDGDIFNDMTNEEIKNKIGELKSLWNNMLYSDIEYQQHVFHDKLEAIKGEDEMYAYFLELLYENEDLKEELAYLHAFAKYGDDVCKKLTKNYEGVILTTAHSDKGEEHPIVFVSLSKFDNKHLHMNSRLVEELEETRRLIYVALTRARDILYVTSRHYVSNVANEEPVLNRFIKEVMDAAGKPYYSSGPAPYKSVDKAAAEKANVGKSRELTPEEKAEFHKLLDGAKQMTVDETIAMLSATK